MSGRKKGRADAFADLLQARREREEVGLPPLPCGSVLTTGRNAGTECPNDPMPNHIRCGWHRFDVPSKRSAQAIAQAARDEMAIHLLPKSMAVVDDVLTREAEVWEDPETGTPVVIREAPKDGDRLRAAAMVMDRIGLAPGTDVRITADVRVVPPDELLIQAMQGMAERMGLLDPPIGEPAHVVIEGSVVEAVDAPLSAEQPASGPEAQAGGDDG